MCKYLENPRRITFKQYWTQPQRNNICHSWCSFCLNEVIGRWWNIFVNLRGFFETVAIKINSNFHSWINLIMLIHVNYDLALHEITCTLYSFQWYSYFGVIEGVVDIFIIYTWWYFKVANIRFHLAPLQYWVAHSGRMVKNCRWCNSQVYVILLFYNMMQYLNELIQFLKISCWP